MPESKAFELNETALAAMTAHAVEGYPEESCGVVLGDDSGNEVHRLVNIQNTLHANDPATFPRDARTAYTIDPKELGAVLEQGEGRGLVFKALYHSHPEHDAYFSAEDKACAMPFGEPTYPDTAQIVISVMSGSVGRVAVYAWNPDVEDYVETTLTRVAGR
jgi:proteasome lid subunit RPN8/RPN11